MADNGIVIKKYAPESGAIVIMSREGTGDDEAVRVFREYARNFGGTVFAGGNAGTLDQVKHIIYAGCERVVFDVSRPGDLEELPEADVKFGSSRLCAYVPDGFTGRDQIFRASEHAELFLVDNEEMAEFVNDISGMDCEILTDVPEDAAADDTLTEGSSDAPAEEKAGEEAADISAAETIGEEPSDVSETDNDPGETAGPSEDEPSGETLVSAEPEESGWKDEQEDAGSAEEPDWKDEQEDAGSAEEPDWIDEPDETEETAEEEEPEWSEDLDETGLQEDIDEGSEELSKLEAYAEEFTEGDPDEPDDPDNYRNEFREMMREMNETPAKPSKVVSVTEEDDFDDYSVEGVELADDYDDYSDEPFDGYSDDNDPLKAAPVPAATGAIGWSDLVKNEKGLVPVIVIDHENKDLLMMAWMDEEAYHKTLETGLMTYHSRSRDSLWVKGETSGHYQKLVSLTADCDLDALKAEVYQTGAACHTGNRSCFFNRITEVSVQPESGEVSGEKAEVKPAVSGPAPVDVLYRDLAVINDRKVNPAEGSYTNYLFDKGLDKILKKVGEETSEIIIAAKNGVKDETVYELGDLMYHLMVLMSNEGISWDDVFRELENRENERKN